MATVPRKSVLSEKKKNHFLSSIRNSCTTKDEYESEIERELDHYRIYYPVFEDSNYYPKPTKNVMEIVSKCNSSNDSGKYSIIKSTVEGILIQFSNPVDPINYQQFQDFFIIYRVFLDPLKLLDICLSRLKWCIDKIQEIIKENKLSYLPASRNVSNDGNPNVASRYKSPVPFAIDKMEVILIRTFVLLRHWILNYYIQDFMNNESLSLKFIDFMNSFDYNSTLKRKIVLNCLKNLKKSWIDQHNKVFDDVEHKININKLHSEKDWLNFRIPVDFEENIDESENIENVGFENNKQTRLSFYALQSSSNPAFRNQNLLSTYGAQQIFKIPQQEDKSLANKLNKISKRQSKIFNILFPQDYNNAFSKNDRAMKGMSDTSVNSDQELHNANSSKRQTYSFNEYTNNSVNSSIIGNIIQSKNSNVLKHLHTNYPESSTINKLAPLTPAKNLEFTISLDEMSKNSDMNEELSAKNNSPTSFKSKELQENSSANNIPSNNSMLENQQVKKFVKYVFSIGTINVPNNDSDGTKDEISEKKFDILGARSIDQVQYLIDMETYLLNQLEKKTTPRNSLNGIDDYANDSSLTDTFPESPGIVKNYNMQETPNTVNGMDNLNLYQTVTSIANSVLSSARKNQIDLNESLLTNSVTKNFYFDHHLKNESNSKTVQNDPNGDDENQIPSHLKISPFLRSLDKSNVYNHRRVSSSFFSNNLDTPSKSSKLKTNSATLKLRPLNSNDDFTSTSFDSDSNAANLTIANGSPSRSNRASARSSLKKKQTLKMSDSAYDLSKHISSITSNGETESNSNVSGSINLSNEFNILHESNDVISTRSNVQHRNILQSSLPGIPKNKTQNNRLSKVNANHLSKVSKNTTSVAYQPKALNSGRISISAAPPTARTSRVASSSSNPYRSPTLGNQFDKGHKKTKSSEARYGDLFRNDLSSNANAQVRHKSADFNEVDYNRANKISRYPSVFANPSFVSKDQFFEEQALEVKILQRKTSRITLREAKNEGQESIKEEYETYELNAPPSHLSNRGAFQGTPSSEEHSLNTRPDKFSKLNGIPQITEYNENDCEEKKPEFESKKSSAHASLSSSPRSEKSFATLSSINTNMIMGSPNASESLRRSYPNYTEVEGLQVSEEFVGKTFSNLLSDKSNKPMESKRLTSPVSPGGLFLNGAPDVNRISTFISDSDDDLSLRMSKTSLSTYHKSQNKEKRDTFNETNAKLDLRRQFHQQHEQSQNSNNESHSGNGARFSYMVYGKNTPEPMPLGIEQHQPKLYGAVRDDEYNDSFKHNLQQELDSTSSSLDFSSIHSSPEHFDSVNGIANGSRPSQANRKSISSSPFKTQNTNSVLYNENASEKLSPSHSARSSQISKTLSPSKGNNPYFIVTSTSYEDQQDQRKTTSSTQSNSTKGKKDSFPNFTMINGKRYSNVSANSPSPNKAELLRQKYLPSQNSASSLSGLNLQKSNESLDDTRDITEASIAENNNAGRKKSHSLQSNPKMLELANLPDKSFSGVDPVDAAMRKLEGAYSTSNDSSMKLKSILKDSDKPESSSSLTQNEAEQAKESAIVEDSKEMQMPNLKKRDDKKRQTVLIEARRSTRLFNVFDQSQKSSKSFLARGSHVSALQQKKDTKVDGVLVNEQITDLLKHYRLTDPNLLLENSDEHIPFILMYSSYDIASQLTLIEQDVLNEIDWFELLELNMQSDLPNFTSWLEVLFQNEKLSGIDLSIARFNLMVDWIISEIVLTADTKMKRNTLQKFIHIAEHCIKLQNFNTVMQIVLALGSPLVQGYASSWRLIDPGDLLTWAELQKTFSVENNYSEVRDFMNELDPIHGCLPFVVLYLGDLISLKEVPNHFHSNSQIINYSKFDNMVNIIKSFIQRVQWGTEFYQIKTIPQLLSKCVYISCLSAEEIELVASSSG